MQENLHKAHTFVETKQPTFINNWVTVKIFKNKKIFPQPRHLKKLIHIRYK